MNIKMFNFKIVVIKKNIIQKLNRQFMNLQVSK